MSESPVAAWSVAQVAQWVSALPLDGAGGVDDCNWTKVAAASCREEEIDGKALLSMSRRDVKDELGIPFGKANVLLECLELAKQGDSSRMQSAGHAEEGEPPMLGTTRSVRRSTPSSSGRVASSASSTLQSELLGMKLTALKKRARSAGVDEDDLDAVDDSDDIKQAVIRLIVAAEVDRSRGDREALRAELAAMKLTALKKRARQEGVDADALEEVDDADDIRAAVIGLILDVSAAASQSAADADARKAALTAELAQLKLRALKDRARSTGVDEDDLEEADDAVDIKSAVIALILTKECGTAGPPPSALPAQPDRLRAELSGMKISALRKRALASGVDADCVDEAIDCDDASVALVELILHAEAVGGGDETELRSELEGLKLGALSKRARGEGMGAEEIEEAMEAEDPKAALVEVILRTHSSPQARTSNEGVLLADSFRSDLAALRLKDLRARARSENIDAGLLEEAMDEDDPKAAVIRLLVNVRSAAEKARLELSDLRLKELRARAKQAGFSPELLEEAADSDEPKAAVIELLLSPAPRRSAQEAEPEEEPVAEQAQALTRSVSSIPADPDHPIFRALEAHSLEAHFEKLLELGVKRIEDLEHMNESDVQQLGMLKFDHAKFISAFITETPHHGVASTTSAGNSGAPVKGGGFSFEGGKHAMFSYNWDDQASVVRVREYFDSLGVPTWMDIDGGMKVNIYDSMASGVGKAAVVIAFISQRYQVSCAAPSFPRPLSQLTTSAPPLAAGFRQLQAGVDAGEAEQSCEFRANAFRVLPCFWSCFPDVNCLNVYAHSQLYL